MRKLFLLSFLFFSSLVSLQASGTYSGIYFTDYEEQASLYFCNYYSEKDFLDIGLSNTDITSLVNNRINLFISITEIDNLSAIDSLDLDKIKKQSHLIDWNVYSDDFGMTLHQTNFLYGLTGVLIGFVFLFGFIQIIISEEHK
ncbi:hypothetical protein [Sulfurimonas sp.]|uniref:hypothetical protein n=1 Tax=Sulfurimonas sp. TaxID=2022749 RepID=UPI0035651198